MQVWSEIVSTIHPKLWGEKAEYQFADDAAFLATSKMGAERATEEYMMVANDFGLTLSIIKTKLMPVGREVTPEDMPPLSVGGEEIESASSRI